MNFSLNFVVITALIIGLFSACNKEDDPTPNPPAPIQQQPVLDADGNSYQTIKIGNQVWMKENLRTTRYCNGDLIPNVTDNNDWSELTTGAWSHYGNDSQYETPYGKLYNWYAVMDTRNICPCGWHVPTDAEWEQLTTFLGGESVAGGKMKSTGTQYWESPNTGATNESGFSGYPGGYRGTETTWEFQFGGIGTYCNWWTTSTHELGSPWVQYLYYIYNQVDWFTSNLGRGHSVRCVKD